MDKKIKPGSSSHPERQKKRKFHGNRHTFEDDTTFTSASAAKLQKSGDEEVIIENNHGYCILEFFSFFATLSTFILCATCKKEIKFSRTAARGLGFKIALKCSCEDIRFIQSSPFINKAYEVNRRIVAAMRLLGVGREGINIFCSVMDICQGIAINTYYSCLENLHSAASAVYNQIIIKAVEEEKELIAASDPTVDPIHMTVSGDGTWKKRGFSSLFGVTTLVAKYSKKVVDTVVKSSFCQGCNLWRIKKNDDIEAYKSWYEEHQDSCTINHNGSAGKMEVDAVIEMFVRSVKLHGVKYAKYIGDGDSKTFKGILDINPYADDPVVEKKELLRCLGSETQNNNESLNSLIWTFAPKHIHSGTRTIEIANYLAVCIFNEGFLPILKILSVMGITIGPEAYAFAEKRNEMRIRRSEIRASDASKEARTDRLAERSAKNDIFEQEEGPMYGAGIAD